LTLLGMVLYGDWYWGAIAGKGVLMCFAPLTALGLLAAGWRWFSPVAGIYAALIHLSTPWIYRISTIAYTEGGLAFYLFASMLAVGVAVEQLRCGGASLGLVFVAGLLAGSGMACKYPGVISVVLPLGVALVVAPFFVRRLGGVASYEAFSPPTPLPQGERGEP